MKNILALAMLFSATVAKSAPVTIIDAVLNTATPQVAQFNVGTGTVRGTLTVGSLVTGALSVGSISASNFTGSGAGLTSLPAAQLTGTIASARLSGAYTGITQVGALSSGTWNGTPIGTQYGGTGQNLINISSGSLIYFSNVGVMSTLDPGPAGRVLQTNAGAAPSWTGAPQINGLNIQNVQTQYLSAGVLPSYVTVNDVSISSVSGSKVIGNISGNAAGLLAPIPLSSLAPGILPFGVVASSITGTGIIAGTYGSSGSLLQLAVRSDGRITSASTFPILILSSAAVVAQFNAVAVSTAALRADMTVVQGQLVQVALSTNSLFSMFAPVAVSTSALRSDLTRDEIVIGQLGVSTASLAAQFGPIAVATASLRSDLTVAQSRIADLNVSTISLQVQLTALVGTASDLQNQIYNVGAATAALNLRLATAEYNIVQLALSTGAIQSQISGYLLISVANNQFGSIAVSTLSLQTQINNIVVSSSSLQAQVAALSVSTASLQTQITAESAARVAGNNALAVSTTALNASMVAGFNAVAVSTTSLQLQVNTNSSSIGTLGISTASLQTQINANSSSIGTLGISTNSLQVQIAALGASTATESAARIAGYNALAVSTTSLQTQITSLGTATSTLRSDTFNQFNTVGTSTNTIQTNVGLATSTLRSDTFTQFNAVGASTASLQTQANANAANIGILGVSTATLSQVKASTGTNNDITDLDALRAIAGPFTVDVGSVTISSNVVVNSSMTASLFVGSGYGLFGVIITTSTPIVNMTFTNTTYGVCTSTLTLTTRANTRLRVSLSATSQNTNANQTNQVTFYVDGGIPSIFNGSLKSVASAANAAASDTNFGFNVLLDPIAAGSHSFCLAFKTAANTGSILNDANHYSQWAVTEQP